MIMTQETIDYLESLKYTGKILPAKYIEKHIIDHHRLMEDIDVNPYIKRAEDLNVKFSYEKSDKKSLDVKYSDDVIDVCVKYENIDDISSLRSHALLAIGITYGTDEYMPDYIICIVVVAILNMLNKIKNFHETTEYISANFSKHYTLYDDYLNDQIGGGGFIKLYKKIFVVLWEVLTSITDDDNDMFEFKFIFRHNEINIKDVLIRLIKDDAVSFNVDNIEDNSLVITITNFCDSNDCFNLVMKCAYALMIVDNSDIEDCKLVSFLSDKLLDVVEDMSLECNKHFSMFYTWMNDGIIKEVENPIIEIEMNDGTNISKLEIPEY